MATRHIQLITHKDNTGTISKIVKKFSLVDSWQASLDDTRNAFHFIVRTGESQSLIDMLNAVTKEDANSRLIVASLEATYPHPDDAPAPTSRKFRFLYNQGILSREEIHDDITQGVTLNRTFILMVIFSTIIACIGLLENNVAVLVGAMVIAPFLGPNLALSYGTTVGNTALIGKALATNIIGISITLLISIALGAIWPHPLDAPELLARTHVHYSTLILAFASGAAAVLAICSASTSTLVGVMVAVALLPPATTMGMFIGNGSYSFAYGACLLLCANVIALNLAAKIVLHIYKIRPKNTETAPYAILIHWISLISLCGLLIALLYSIYHYNN